MNRCILRINKEHHVRKERQWINASFKRLSKDTMRADRSKCVVWWKIDSRMLGQKWWLFHYVNYNAWCNPVYWTVLLEICMLFSSLIAQLVWNLRFSCHCASMIVYWLNFRILRLTLQERFKRILTYSGIQLYSNWSKTQKEYYILCECTKYLVSHMFLWN